MGITILQKSDLNRPKPNPKVAIVLAGGAVTGGAFKVGGLQALDCYLENMKVTDFDTFVGLSAGSIISAFLANGISPEEMFKSLQGESAVLDSIQFSDFYYPNIEDLLVRPLHYMWDLLTFVPDFALQALLSSSLLQKDLRKALFQALRCFPAYLNPSFVRSEDPHQDSHQGGLPSPVGAEKTEDFTGGDIECHPVQRHGVLEALTDVFDTDCVIHVAPRISRLNSGSTS